MVFKGISSVETSVAIPTVTFSIQLHHCQQVKLEEQRSNMEHDNLSGGFCSGLTSTADHNRISERTYHDQGCGRNHSKNSVGFQRITLATVIFYILLLGRQSSVSVQEFQILFLNAYDSYHDDTYLSIAGFGD